MPECHKRYTPLFRYQDQKRVLFMGTSITDESLDTDELKLLLDAHVEKMISYTILRKDGKVDPTKCLEESVKIVKKEIFNVVVVQQGTNEVSNAKKGEGSEKFKELAKHMTKLLKEVEGNETKIVILKTPPRIDGKKSLNIAYNKSLEEEFAGREEDGVFLRELELVCNTRGDQVCLVSQLSSFGLSLFVVPFAMFFSSWFIFVLRFFQLGLLRHCT